MAILTVNKELAGEEDILGGEGTVTQLRGATNQTVTRLNRAKWVIDAMALTLLNTVKFIRARLGNSELRYYWDPANTDPVDGVNVIAGDVTPGNWLLIPDSSAILTPNVQTTAGAGAYTLQLSDSNRLVSMQNALAQTVTIPLAPTINFPIGSEILVEQGLAGQTDIVGDVGVTLNSFSGFTAFAGQYTTIRLIHKALNVWLLVGSTDLVSLILPAFGCLNTMSYAAQSLDVSSIFTASCVFVRPNGADIYIADSGGFPVTVDRYTMSTAFDLTTALLTSSQNYATLQSIVGIGFSQAGDRIFLTDEAAFGDEEVHQFDLSSVWDTTTPNSEVTFTIVPSVLDGKPADDGSRFYVLEVGGNLQEYTMNTPGTIVGMTLANTFNVDAAVGSGTCQSFLVSGSTLYTLMLNSAGGDEVFQFNLATPLSLAAPTLTGATGLPFNTGAQEGVPRGITADPTLEHFYTVGAAETVFRYSTIAQAACP